MDQDLIDFDRLAATALKHVAGALTPDEQAELSAFLARPGYQERFEEMVARASVERDMRLWEEAEAMNATSLVKVDRALKYLSRASRLRTLRTWAVAAAATSALVLGTTIYLHNSNPPHPLKVLAASTPNLLPGGQKAILTLGTRKQIVLDNANNGRLAAVPGAYIYKSTAGQIEYAIQQRAAGLPAAADFNTLSTPMGGMYQVVLPDGSVVYLNSASSLHYPTYFDPQSPRVVELTGEAFFKVSASASRPFRVKVNGQLVQALGTVFDINGYQDEPEIRTTLIQGRVRVSTGSDSILLRPGEQVTGTSTGNLSATKVDTESTVAWKNGYFRFMGASMPEVARQLSRWYNFKIVYKGDPGRTCAAEISRNRPASEVLEALKESGFEFTINQGEIDVKPGAN